jgi:FkbM family methyltransferase
MNICRKDSGFYSDLISRYKDRISVEDKLRIKEMLDLRIEATFASNVICCVSSGRELKRCRNVVDPEIVKWLDSFRQQDIFYDIGANIGTFSLIVANKHKGAVKIVAIEPAYKTFQSLVNNIVVNDFTSIITAFQIALSQRTGLNVLNYHDLVPGGSLHALGAAIDYKKEVFEPVIRQQIMSFSLDDLIEWFHLPIPTHMKIDVDGIEPDILRGAVKTLESPYLRSVLVEVVKTSDSDGRPDELKDYVCSKGFDLFEIYFHGSRSEDYPRIFDYLFVRK